MKDQVAFVTGRNTNLVLEHAAIYTDTGQIKSMQADVKKEAVCNGFRVQVIGDTPPNVVWEALSPYLKLANEAPVRGGLISPALAKRIGRKEGETVMVDLSQFGFDSIVGLFSKTFERLFLHPRTAYILAQEEEDSLSTAKCVTIVAADIYGNLVGACRAGVRQ